MTFSSLLPCLKWFFLCLNRRHEMAAGNQILRNGTPAPRSDDLVFLLQKHVYVTKASSSRFSS